MNRFRLPNHLIIEEGILNDIPEDIRKRFYSNGTDEGDFHTAYIGQIVSAYIIKED